MAIQRRHNFWRDAPQPARWAGAAAAFLLAVAIIPFVLLIPVVVLSEHVSPATAVFGPLPGNPLIVWLYYTLPPAAFQALAALALRHHAPGLRVAGIVGTLAVAATALTWVAAMVFLGVRWLVTGKLAGDFSDLLGMVFFGIPVLLVIAGLTIRAAYLGIREFLGRGAPVARPLP